MRSTFAVQNIDAADVSIKLNDVGTFFTLKIEGHKTRHRAQSSKTGYCIDLFLNGHGREERADELELLQAKVEGLLDQIVTAKERLRPTNRGPRGKVIWRDLQYVGNVWRRLDEEWGWGADHRYLCPEEASKIWPVLNQEDVREATIVVAEFEEDLPKAGEGVAKVVYLRETDTDLLVTYQDANGDEIERAVYPPVYRELLDLNDGDEGDVELFATVVIR